MYEIVCYDLKGNTINNFYQWDVDQKIVIKLNGCDDSYLSIAPEIHFTNMKRNEALIVRSAVSNHDTITCDVPNILLQESVPILLYVYLTDAEDVSSQKTILSNEIPVRKRAKPSDYLYVENIKRITAEMIKDEIEASTENTRTQAINDINSTKDAANASVTKTKNESEAYITNVKESAENSITTTKNDAEAHITEVKDASETSIVNTKNNSESIVTNKKNEFIATGESLIESSTAIRDNTQSTYDQTVNVAKNTQSTIEASINTMITDNGLEMKVIDDGDGNVVMTILVQE